VILLINLGVNLLTVLCKSCCSFQIENLSLFIFFPLLQNNLAYKKLANLLSNLLKGLAPAFLAGVTHSSLFGPFVNYTEKSFVELAIGLSVVKLFFFVRHIQDKGP